MSESMALDASKVQAYAQVTQDRVRHRSQVLWRADPVRVGQRAGKLARCFYQEDHDEEARECELVARCAGYLVYAMEAYDLNFEGVCNVAEYQVALVVAAVSPDVRLPPGKRRDALCSSVGRGGVLAQIVKLAEVLSVCERILVMPRNEAIVAQAADLKRWVDDHIIVLKCLHTLALAGKTKKELAEELGFATRQLISVARRIEAAKQAAKDARRAERVCRREARELRRLARAVVPSGPPPSEMITAPRELAAVI